MKYVIEYTLQANNDLRNIINYTLTTSNSKEIAYNVYNKIKDSIDILCDFPKSGFLPKDRMLLIMEYRYIVCYDYLIFYKINDEFKKIIIISIFHSKQNYVEAMKKII